MQRIKIINFDQPDPQKIILLDQYTELLQLLGSHVSPRTLSVLAIPQKINTSDQYGWFTRLEGQPILLSQIANEADKNRIKATVASRLYDINTSVKLLLNSPQLITEQRTLLTDWSLRINHSEQIIFVVNDEPVILFNFEKTPQPQVPLRRGLFRWWQLLILILFLFGLLWLLWYLFCPLSNQPSPIKTITPSEQPLQQLQVEPENTSAIAETVIQSEAKETEPILPIDSNNTPNCMIPSPTVNQPKSSRIVIIFDNSASMWFTLMEPPEKINEFIKLDFNRLTKQEAESYAQRMFRLPSRLSASKQSAISNIDKLQPDIDIGLVVLQDCPKAKNFGFFKNRSKLKNIISKLEPLKSSSATPLYSGLKQASALLDGVNSDDYILLISDGEDSCTKSDICTLAKSIASQKPRLQINIIDLAGLHNIDCVAETTGGKVYIAQNNQDLINQMNKVMSNMPITQPICQ